jgi:hypothetical protein
MEESDRSGGSLRSTIEAAGSVRLTLIIITDINGHSLNAPKTRAELTRRPGQGLAEMKRKLRLDDTEGGPFLSYAVE